MPGPHAHHWTLDPSVDYLNHGSFGACPAPVLAFQAGLRDELEREPVDFLVRRLPERLDAARRSLAGFVGADPDGLVPVANATSGVNTVLRSVELGAGDEVVVTDHAYGACRNALDEVARARGAVVRQVAIPFPGTTPEAVEAAVAAAVTPRTRLALIDHVTSPTGVVYPLERIVKALAGRGIDCLVDGAHAPGMLPLDVGRLGCAYYTGNCHKWICAPKGAAFLWVRGDRRERIRPLVISHGATSVPPGRSKFFAEFDWTGTCDPTAFLSVPRAIEFVGGILPGGWAAVREHNHRLVCDARKVLCEAVEVPAPCPEGMLGSLASVPLPEGWRRPGGAGGELDPLQERLRRDHAIEVPVMRYPGSGLRFVRVSAQLYNVPEQYQRLAKVLKSERVEPGVSA